MGPPQCCCHPPALQPIRSLAPWQLGAAILQDMEKASSAWDDGGQTQGSSTRHDGQTTACRMKGAAAHGKQGATYGKQGTTAHNTQGAHSTQRPSARTSNQPAEAADDSSESAQVELQGGLRSAVEDFTSKWAAKLSKTTTHARPGGMCTDRP